MTAKSITQAKAAYQTGDWTEAERLCRIILAEKSDDLDALNLLGIIAAQTQRPQEALTLLSQAVGVDPGHATARATNHRRRLNGLTKGCWQLRHAASDFSG
jgi:Flp pilus assembly protein TadD